MTYPTVTMDFLNFLYGKSSFLRSDVKKAIRQSQRTLWRQLSLTISPQYHH